jgi:hypothetical protein
MKKIIAIIILGVAIVASAFAQSATVNAANLNETPLDAYDVAQLKTMLNRWAVMEEVRESLFKPGEGKEIFAHRRVAFKTALALIELVQAQAEGLDVTDLRAQLDAMLAAPLTMPSANTAPAVVPPAPVSPAPAYVQPVPSSAKRLVLN